MEKIELGTPDITQENIEKLGELFPQVMTEVEDAEGNIQQAVDFDALKELLGDVAEGQRERYQFTWPGKREAKAEARRSINKTLIPCPEKSVDWDTTENLYIEGDNLDALKILKETYAGKIKMIYIDPPYNTGHDFIYDDGFSQTNTEYASENGEFDERGGRLVANLEGNGRFHSDWCSMMYPRLLLARDLLSTEGIIFISIDENEFDNLKKICSEIFGSENCIGTFSVENNPKGRKNSSFISVSSEYCIAFAKKKTETFFLENVPKKASDMTLDSDGRYVHNSGKRVLVGENSFNNVVLNENSEKNYSVYYRDLDKRLICKKEPYGDGDKKLLNDGFSRYWSFYNGQLVENTYTLARFMKLFEENALDFSNGKIYEKNFNDTIRIKSQLVNREYEAIVRGEKRKFSMELTTTGAGTYLKTLFNSTEVIFPASKNTGFLKVLITLIDGKESLFLDFFSGSGSFADAVMQQNAIDDGNRKVISVQIPEVCEEATPAKKFGYNDICEIGEERIRRAGLKIAAEIEECNKQLKIGEEPKRVPDIGFRVMRIDSSNFKNSNTAPSETLQTSLLDIVDNVKEGRTDLDLLFEVLPKFRIPYSAPIEERELAGKKCFVVDEAEGLVTLVACFDTEVGTDTIEAIAKMQPFYAVMRDSSMIDDSTYANFEELFKTYSPDTIRRVI